MGCRKMTGIGARLMAVAGLAIGLAGWPMGARIAQAQPSLGVSMQRMQMRMGGGMARRWAAENEEMDDAEEEAGWDEYQQRMSMMGRGGDGQMSPPKTDLGRLIMQGEIHRDARSVLAARAKLSAKAREEKLGLGAEAKRNEGAEGPTDEGGGAAMEEATTEESLQIVPEMMDGGEESEAGLDEAGMNVMELMRRMSRPGRGTVEEASDEKAAGKSKKRKEEMERARKEAERFHLLVTAGKWEDVGVFLKEKVKEDAGTVYEWMLGNLAENDSTLMPGEVIELSDVAPVELTDQLVTKLGRLLKGTQERGVDAKAVAGRIARGTGQFGGADPVKRKRAAGLLVAAGLTIQAQEYLPPIEQARAGGDVELLNLYAVYFSALAKERTGQERERAIEEGWRTCMDALAIKNAPSRERGKAVGKALEFFDDVPTDVADGWLTAMYLQRADGGCEEGVNGAALEDDLGWDVIDRVNRRCQSLLQREAPAEKRLAALKRLQRVGKAILGSEHEGASAARWNAGLNILTMTILDEADFARRVAMRKQRGMDDEDYGYGRRYGREREAEGIDAQALGELLPDARWLSVIDPGLASKLELMAATTAGGAGDVKSVLEMIRPIAASDPLRAEKLADALLAAWPTYVGGSANLSRDGSWMRPYGGRGRGMWGGWGGSGGGVPLTRARQERNLEQLRDAIAQLREAGIKNLKTDSMLGAFAASCSPAEVYAREQVEKVFGPMERMSAAMGFKLASLMRGQLAGAWRMPQVQEQMGTNRSNEDLNEELRRGYELAMGVVEEVMRRVSASEGQDRESERVSTWELWTLKGDLCFDASEFEYGVQVAAEAAAKSAPQSGQTSAGGGKNTAQQVGQAVPTLGAYEQLRAEAFAAYRRGVEAYREELAAGQTKPSARVFVQWFNAAIGASDVGALTRQDRVDEKQMMSVRAALGRMGSVGGSDDERAEFDPTNRQVRAHLGMFAKETYAASTQTSPQLRPKYLRNVLAVVGEHPDGRAARDRLAYYDDLNKEVELRLEVDEASGASIGGLAAEKGGLVGMRFSILASRAVTRESGGFARYLMTEQYNYMTGQEENPREELEKLIRESWEKDFEVVSITFAKPGTATLQASRPGWDQTPMAYAVLKAKDASKDRVPSVRMDIEFSEDTGSGWSGYGGWEEGGVLLSMESNAAMLTGEGSGERGSSLTPTKAAAIRDLAVEMIFDDRQAAGTGLATLEVRATGKGLIRSLDQVLAMSGTGGDRPGVGAFGGELKIRSVEDQGLMVPDLDMSSGKVEPMCERSWMLTLEPIDTRRGAGVFTFPHLVDATGKVTARRYADADVMDVKPTDRLVLAGFGGNDGGMLATWVVAGLGIVGLMAGGMVIARRRARQRSGMIHEHRWVVPQNLTPMGAIGMLRKISELNGAALSPDDQLELNREIAQLEDRFFAPGSEDGGGEVMETGVEQLRVVVARWVMRIK